MLYVEGFNSERPVVSLADFDTSAKVPKWLPANCWQNVLSISTLPGPLNGICVDIAENGDEWQEWFQSDEPERADVPGYDDDKSAEGTKQSII